MTQLAQQRGTLPMQRQPKAEEQTVVHPLCPGRQKRAVGLQQPIGVQHANASQGQRQQGNAPGRTPQLCQPPAQPGGDIGCKACQPGMGQRADQHQVEQLGRDQGEDGDLYRRADVLLGIEARRQHLDHDDAEQPDGISHQRMLGHQRIMCIELPVLEQRHCQRLGQDPQGQCARQYQDEAQAQPPIEDARVFLAILAGIGARQRRQQNGAEGHAQHTGR